MSDQILSTNTPFSLLLSPQQSEKIISSSRRSGFSSVSSFVKVNLYLFPKNELLNKSIPKEYQHINRKFSIRFSTEEKKYCRDLCKKYKISSVGKLLRRILSYNVLSKFFYEVQKENEMLFGEEVKDGSVGG